MKSKFMNNNIPYSILIKIILTRVIILWEVLAKYLFFLLGILVIFLTLTLLNFFTYISFWFHVFFLQNHGVTSSFFKSLGPLLKKLEFTTSDY